MDSDVTDLGPLKTTEAELRFGAYWRAATSFGPLIIPDDDNVHELLNGIQARFETGYGWFGRRAGAQLWREYETMDAGFEALSLNVDKRDLSLNVDKQEVALSATADKQEVALSATADKQEVALSATADEQKLALSACDPA